MVAPRSCLEPDRAPLGRHQNPPGLLEGIRGGRRATTNSHPGHLGETGGARRLADIPRGASRRPAVAAGAARPNIGLLRGTRGGRRATRNSHPGDLGGTGGARKLSDLLMRCRCLAGWAQGGTSIAITSPARGGPAPCHSTAHGGIAFAARPGINLGLSDRHPTVELDVICVTDPIAACKGTPPRPSALGPAGRSARDLGNEARPRRGRAQLANGH